MRKDEEEAEEEAEEEGLHARLKQRRRGFA